MTKIAVTNVIRPDSKPMMLDATKFNAMRDAYLKVLPADGPGLTPAEIRVRLEPVLSQDAFPGGAKAGWWAKAVQLDLEAKGVIARGDGRPVRLRRAG
ncbi:hypothetical protein DOI34_24260 [Salmonella enterica subsp. enterica serovar Virchow]|nr:hypothetical protein [Salmonella enterica subsp. enterica serovar Virchow]